eukprot:jgi/Mesvir1/21488/Mv24129-RA.1
MGNFCPEILPPSTGEGRTSIPAKMRKTAAVCRKIIATDALGSTLLQEWKVRLLPVSTCGSGVTSYAVNAAVTMQRRDSPMPDARARDRCIRVRGDYELRYCTLRFPKHAHCCSPLLGSPGRFITKHVVLCCLFAEEKSGLVAGVFQRVAPTYDLMNDLMSLGLHRLWKDRLVETLRPFPGMSHLDVAGGTGDVAFRVARAILQQSPDVRFGVPPEYTPSTAASMSASASTSTGASNIGGAEGPSEGVASPRRSASLRPSSSLTVLDINPAMLAVGEERAIKSGLLEEVRGRVDLTFVQGDAEKLPVPDASMDSYTIAFGIRNVTRIDAALREAFRVLKKGGRFLCLEFSKVEPAALRQIYDAYSFQGIPAMGRLVAGDRESYAYLVESIRQFPDQTTFAGMVEAAGFKRVSYENLHMGVVAIHSGFKL